MGNSAFKLFVSFIIMIFISSCQSLRDKSISLQKSYEERVLVIKNQLLKESKDYFQISSNHSPIMFRCFDFTLFLVNNKQDSTVSVIKLNCDNTIESKHDYDLWKKYSILFLGLNSYNCWKDTAIELSPDQWPNTFTIIKFQNNILDSSVTFEDQWVQSYYFDSTRYANDLAINYAKSVYRVQESKILSQLTYDLVWGELKNVR